MKTAASPATRQPATPESKGGGARKPFFAPAATAVQTKADPRPEHSGPLEKEELIQPRLNLGRPGDRYEIEADRVADRVVEGRAATAGLAGGITALAQRREEEDELPAQTGPDEAVQAQRAADSEALPEEPVQAKAAPEEPSERALTDGEEPAQRRATDTAVPGRGAGSAAAETARQIRAAHGGGNPLPGPVREKMEAAFSTDLSGVRIHTDAPAALLAQNLNAQAFTRGNDIFFNEGRFAPASRAGQHLLAHELTHTIQQGAVPAAGAAAEARGSADSAHDGQDVIRLTPETGDQSYQVRPEIAEAVRLARGEIGRVNAKRSGADGKRIGWERLREYFRTAFGGPVISEQVIDRITTIEKSDSDGNKTALDALPSWCGIFTWWAMKKAGLPIPDWKLGAPALDALRLRPGGELPRKGDIAIDVLPYNHFGMVTGLESRQDAEGKPRKLTRVATINGNTAGEDNLGGQVQERWDPLERWDHFLDPVGKLNLPEVPLVTVGREPGPLTPAAADAASTESAAPAAHGGKSGSETQVGDHQPGADAAELEAEVAPPPGDLMGAQLPEPDLTLPPRGEGGPAEQVAAVAPVELSGNSDEATAQFIDASPSAMAAAQPLLAATVDGKMQAEQRELAQNPPVLALKTSGAVATPIAGAADLPAPAEATLGDGISGPDPGNLEAVAAAAPAPFRANAEREKALEEEDSGSFWDRFMSFLRNFTRGIRTSDDSVDTSAGARPTVALAGEADPGRMNTPREEATAALRDQRDAQVDALRNHPGQAQIQPRQLDEAPPLPVSTEAAASIDAQADDQVAAYAAAPLPQDVRDNADARIAKTLTPNLADARAQTVAAASARDSDQAREIDTAQQAAAQLNTDTDAAQRRLVIDNRTRVAKLQGEGIGEACEHVDAFNRAAAAEQTQARRDIGAHVKSEEARAKGRLEEGEKDAEKARVDAEQKAAAEKARLEKEQENQSWWDRAKNAIKKAVKFITDAIDKIFTALRDAVKTIIDKARNAAIGLINKARNWVVDKLNTFRDWAKSKVDKYLKDTFPGLARRINGAIDSVTDTAIAGVNYVADKAIEGINKLASALAAALDKILATFQTALKTAVRVVGAVLQGDFAEALRAAIEGACEIAGVDPGPVFDFFDRAGKAILKILKDPVGFIKKLFGAVGDGVAGFFKNIKKHLIEGVIGWLTGALSEVNLTGPFEFSPKGILSIALQILGLTYDNIKARVIKKFPAAAKVFDAVEKGFALLKRLVTEGPGALWEEIKSQVASLKETVMGAIRNWLITTVIKEGIIWLLSLTNPASAIVKAVKLVFDLVRFLVERYQQIKDFIVSVYEAVAEVAAGNFGKVTVAVENALARVTPVLISLLASILGLGGIAKQVKKVIETITKPINRAIDWVVDKIVAFAKKIIGKAKAGAKKVKEKAKEAAKKILRWWQAKTGFKDSTGASHTLSYQGEKKSAKLYVASTPTQIQPFLNERKQQVKKGGTAYTLTDIQAAESYYKTHIVPAENKLKTADTGGAAAKQAKGVDANKTLADDLQKHLDHLGTTWLSKFFDPADDKDFPPPRLPVMADNVKARGFDADYLVAGSVKNGYKHKVRTGSESGDHVGHLDGWKALQGAKLTSGGAKYVRMHLLPHKLGGDAVDSNLTPARGDLFNTPFSAAVEQPAIQSATEGVEANRKPIWYKFEISYYPASTKPPAVWTTGAPYPAAAFPNRIHAQWGFYKARDANTKQIARDKPAKQKTEHPPLPDLAVAPPAINRDGPSALLHALQKQDKAVTGYFVSDILIKHRPYSSKTQMKEVTWLKFGGEREATRRQYVKAAYDAVGVHVTMD